MLDTVENRTRLSSALGQTLQRLSVHRTMRESSLVIGIGEGVPDLLEDDVIRGEMPSLGSQQE